MFGRRTLVQRCQVHKLRNVLGHLPDERHSDVRAGMREVYKYLKVKTAKRLRNKPGAGTPKEASKRGGVAARGTRRDAHRHRSRPLARVDAFLLDDQPSGRISTDVSALLRVV